MTVLSGSIVRVWGVLERILIEKSLEITKADSLLRIVNVPLRNEGSLIGVK